MAHSDETRRIVRNAYVYQAQPLNVAAERAQISFGTATRWKKLAQAAGDDWDRARSANRMAGEGAQAVTQEVLENFVILFQSTVSELKADTAASPLAKAEALSRLSDAYNKTMSAVSKGSPTLSRLAIAMEVLQMLGKFIRTDHPKLAAPFLEVLEPFGEELTKVYG